MNESRTPSLRGHLELMRKKDELSAEVTALETLPHSFAMTSVVSSI